MIKIFVGLSSSLSVKNNRQQYDLPYVNSIQSLWLYSIILPYKINKEDINNYLDLLSGIVLCGGDDINPECYGKKPMQN